MRDYYPVSAAGCASFLFGVTKKQAEFGILPASPLYPINLRVCHKSLNVAVKPLAMRFAIRPPHLCRSGSPDLDPFVIRRAQTTEGVARAEKNAALYRRTRACPSPSSARPNARGGNPLGCADGIRGAPRYGKNRDQEVSPTERIEI